MKGGRKEERKEGRRETRRERKKDGRKISWWLWHIIHPKSCNVKLNKGNFIQSGTRRPEEGALTHYHSSQRPPTGRDLPCIPSRKCLLNHPIRRKKDFSLPSNKPSQWEPLQVSQQEAITTLNFCFLRWSFVQRMHPNFLVLSIMRCLSPLFAEFAYSFCYGTLVPNCNSLLYSNKLILLVKYFAVFSSHHPGGFSGHVDRLSSTLAFLSEVPHLRPSHH